MYNAHRIVIIAPWMYAFIVKKDFNFMIISVSNADLINTLIFPIIDVFIVIIAVQDALDIVI